MTREVEARYVDNLGIVADMLRLGADATADFAHEDWAPDVGEQLDQAADVVEACISRIRSVGVIATVTVWETDDEAEPTM